MPMQIVVEIRNFFIPNSIYLPVEGYTATLFSAGKKTKVMCQADRVKITCLYYYYLLLLLLLLLIIIIIIILSLLTGILVGLVGRFGTPPDQRPPNRHYAIAPSSHLTAPKFSPALIVLFNWLPFWLLPLVIAETGCFRC